MLEVTQQPRHVDFRVGDWRLEFDWRDDRWQHGVSRRTSEGWQPVLTSVEGTVQDNWPCSPPFQHAFVEQIDATCAEIQLVGQAGKSHYSGAIRFHGQTGRIDFDLAVQIKTAPPASWILSTYRRDRSANAMQGHSVTMVVETLSDHPVPLLELVMAEGDAEQLRTTYGGTAPWPERLRQQTVRWKYSWQLSGCA